jgi:hypothetical protein
LKVGKNVPSVTITGFVAWSRQSLKQTNKEKVQSIKKQKHDDKIFCDSNEEYKGLLLSHEIIKTL